MTKIPTRTQFEEIRQGYDENPSRSLSLHADAYTGEAWYGADLKAIVSKTWQWVCHVEKVHEPGSYTTVDIAGNPVAIVRDK
ncbi:hypothetical protein [uncultured Roseobacter sp.]|uniref:hypothetical protein n=1 Tax=uncultured Roseobacter sp. TaxID=114847 RepID=UPI0026226903|nr:hypothetical protein [uncultured Roseobacter sp.]